MQTVEPNASSASRGEEGTKPQSEYVHVKLKAGQKIYQINKVTGGIIGEFTGKIHFMDNKRFIKPEPDIFYWGALNAINAKFVLETIIDKFTQKQLQ